MVLSLEMCSRFRPIRSVISHQTWRHCIALSRKLKRLHVGIRTDAFSCRAASGASAVVELSMLAEE